MAAIHFIGAGNLQGWQTTACGLVGRATLVTSEYDTPDNRRIEAHFHTWRGVTCRRCLRNPHAPGGRLAHKGETDG